MPPQANPLGRKLPQFDYLVMTWSSNKLDLDAFLQCMMSIFVKNNFFILSHLRSALKGCCIFEWFLDFCNVVMFWTKVAVYEKDII